MKKYNFDGNVITLPYTYYDGDMTITTSNPEWIYEHGGTDYEEPAPVVHEPTLEDVKYRKVSEIDAYDISSEVNGFSINGIDGWLDRDTRTSLMNTVNIEKSAGMSETTLWFGTNSLVLPCDVVMGMLAQLEMYAHQCYNVTQRHKFEVMNLETIEEVNEYDITADYPAKLSFGYE